MAIQRYDIRKPDGEFEERYWNPSNTPMLDSNGEVRWIIHAVEDVTQMVHLKTRSEVQIRNARDLNRVIAELRDANALLAQTLADKEALARGHAHLASIVESSGCAIVGIAVDGTVTAWNRSAEIMLGYSSSEIVGKPVSILFAPGHTTDDRMIVRRVLQGEEISQYETVRAHKDGRLLNVSLTVSPIIDSHGKVIGASAIIRDITVEKLAQEEVARLNLDRIFLADLVESSPYAVVSRTNDGVIRSWNRSAEEIFGFKAEEMVGRVVELSPEVAAEAKDVEARLRAGEPSVQYDSRRLRKNGEVIDVSITAFLIRNQDGEITGTSRILRDITDLKRAQVQAQDLQTQLAHLDRLATMGQMSTAIAHELNQPLAAVGNYASAALRFLQNDAVQSQEVQSARLAIEKAAAQTIRAANIIRSLRNYVEKRDSSRAPENLNDLIQEALALGAVDLKHSNIKLVLALDSSLPDASVDKIQFQQVMLNLIRNAADAMAHSQQRELTISTATDSGSALVVVRDTGPGFTSEVLDHLFQPFVTSKADGMGIGLSVCRSIIEAFGGRIVAANAGPGAIFSIRLPLVQGSNA